MIISKKEKLDENNIKDLNEIKSFSELQKSFLFKNAELIKNY